MDEGVRLDAPQLADGRHGGVRHVPRQRVRQLRGVLAQLLLPGVGPLVQSGQTRRRGDGQAAIAQSAVTAASGPQSGSARSAHDIWRYRPGG